MSRGRPAVNYSGKSILGAILLHAPNHGSRKEHEGTSERSRMGSLMVILAPYSVHINVVVHCRNNSKCGFIKKKKETNFVLIVV